MARSLKKTLTGGAAACALTDSSYGPDQGVGFLSPWSGRTDQSVVEQCGIVATSLGGTVICDNWNDFARPSQKTSTQ